MAKYRVLITAPYFLPVVERFRPRFDEHDIELVVHDVGERAEEEDLLEVIDSIDGVICGDDRFTERVLQCAARLRVISKWGTGIDSIDQEACLRLGIAVCNTPDAFSLPVADTVLGYALAFARNACAMDQAMKRGEWRKIPGFSLSEATFGIVGVGDVGRRVAERAAAFGGRLLGTDIREIDPDVVDSTGLQSVSLGELLRQSDIVSVNCDLNPTSYHLIDAEKLSWMRSTAFLINTARGPIVDQAALVAALQSGELGGAALDVFEDEPLPDDSPLVVMDNVLLAPHNANSSPTAWERVHQNTFENLVRELERRVER
jgi:D-3-phosphoglycerate dehydrogenase